MCVSISAGALGKLLSSRKAVHAAESRLALSSPLGWIRFVHRLE